MKRSRRERELCIFKYFFAQFRFEFEVLKCDWAFKIKSLQEKLFDFGCVTWQITN
jgi:hypothetical protein